MNRCKILALITITVGGFHCSNAQTWTQTSAPHNPWTAVAMSADGTKLAAIAPTKNPTPIYYSTNSGASWTSNASPTQIWQNIVSSADGNILLASVASYLKTNVVYFSTNAGATWTGRSNAPVIGQIACSADGGKWIVSAGSNGVFTSTDFGVSWTSNSVPAGFWSAVASSADGATLAAVMSTNTSGGSYFLQIYVSSDSGNSWNLSDAPSLTWRSIAASADGTRWVAVATHTAYTPGAIYTSVNSGSHWTISSAVNNAWQSVASSADGCDLIAAAPWDASAVVAVPLYLSSDGGATWISTNSLAEYWSYVASSADGNQLVAISNLGTIWSARATPRIALNLTLTNGELAFSWLIPSTDLVLQQRPDLATGSWVTVTNQPVLNDSTLLYQVILAPDGPSGVYRLSTP
jgi:hypothetical protein